MSNLPPPPPAPLPPPVGPPPVFGASTRKKRNWKKTAFVVGGVFVALMIIGALIGPPADKKSDTPSTATEAVKAATTTTGDPDAKATKDGNVALCRDGSYSDNHDFAATCSGSDGIDKWLATFGQCQDRAVIKMSADATCRDNDGFKNLLPVDYKPKAAKGDIARCKDSTYSDNTDFAATCASHSGVSKWLAPYGKCKDGHVIKLSKKSSCDGHDGFQALLPADYVPPTTTTTTTIPPPPTTAPPATVPPPPAETVSQSNARRSASNYLDYSAFSRSGLIKQLEYEGFSTADATYGVEALNADWNEQAAKSAADYLSNSSFSRSGLIDQLVYEGFTRAQAEYGVSTTGL